MRNRHKRNVFIIFQTEINELLLEIQTYKQSNVPQIDHDSPLSSKKQSINKHAFPNQKDQA